MRQKGIHRRQYLPGTKITHYDILKWQQHTLKFARLSPSNAMTLVRAAGRELKNAAVWSRSGTDSHVGAMAEVKAYALVLGAFRGPLFRVEVFLLRAWGWLRGRDRSYRPYRPALVAQ